MLPEFTFQADGATYHVCYNARARYLFEQMAGYPLEQLAALRRPTLSDVEVPRLVLAGLEGCRVRQRARKAPWTLDEVLDVVIADLGPDDRLRLVGVCLEAVAAAFKTAAAPEAATGAEGKAPTTV